MLLNQVKIRRLTWPLQNITLFFTFKYSWVAFAVCFGSSSIWTMKQCPISFSPFGWIWADSISLYTSELIRLLLSSVSSSLNTSNPVPLEVMYAHAITLPPPCFTDDIVCFWSWAVPSLLHTFFFPSFWYRLILISAIQRMLFQKCSGFFRCFLAKTNQALFAPSGEPSVFALVKSSLDCRLWQWHVCLLESVLLLAGCYERVFLYHGEDSQIIHHFCPPWTSRPLYVAELNSVFFFLRMY